MTRATPAQSSRPVRTMTSLTTERAVSRPSIPKAASTKACSLSWRAWGAWSVAAESMVPSDYRDASVCGNWRDVEAWSGVSGEHDVRRDDRLLGDAGPTGQAEPTG